MKKLLILLVPLFSACSINRSEMRSAMQMNRACLLDWKLSARQCEQLYLDYGYVSVQQRKAKTSTRIVLAPEEHRTTVARNYDDNASLSDRPLNDYDRREIADYYKRVMPLLEKETWLTRIERRGQ